MNYFERLSESIPNKFAEDIGPFGTVSSIEDEDGFYTHKICMWLT